jgi:hypothetical protein
MIDAMSIAAKASDARDQLRKWKSSLDVRRKMARRDVKMARPAAAMPMQYRTKVASRVVESVSRPSWMEEGQEMSLRLRWKGPTESSSPRMVLMSKWSV